MGQLRFFTAGESHGPQLTGILEGLPSGLSVSSERINAQLARRQRGHGRGGRMKIEKDRAVIVGGVRGNKTLGSPVALVVENADHANWQGIMNPEGVLNGERVVTRARPSHADLAGALKYDTYDVRNILERSSARETTMRVALGALARAFLEDFGVKIFSHVRSIGSVEVDARLIESLSFDEIYKRAEADSVGSADPEASIKMVSEIDQAGREGDTLGGVVEIVATGLPAGLGSHVHWDRKLDARLAGALMSINAVKGVGLGIGFEAARRRGSMAHDPIAYEAGEFKHLSNRAGGINAGMTNGGPLILTVAMKPISTLAKPLPSVDIVSKQAQEAAYERSDVCAVTACGVVAEAMTAFVLADAWLEKFGGDSMKEIHKNVESYLEHVKAF